MTLKALSQPLSFEGTPAYPKLLLCMKLTTIILITTALQVSATGLGQNVTLKYQNAPVKRIFKEIIRQTSVSIIYKEAEMEQLSKVSIDVKNVSIEEALNECFKNQPYRFKIVNNTIVINEEPRSIKLVETVKPVPPPPVEVKGKITDENGSPLPGASVKVKGNKNGVSSDVNGLFSIISPQQTGLLIISNISYETREIPFSPTSGQINIALKLKDNKLTDVVVVAYGSESKATQTSAVSSIKSSDISHIPSSQLSTSLAGRLPGTQIVQNSGFVGANAAITIRGSNTAALYVIDNVVTDKAQFDVLDPNEVESISILKDAAAAAIYGARASGGVVVIKTKSGRPGKVTVNYQGIGSTNRTVKPFQNWTPEQEVVYANNSAITTNRLSAAPDPNFQVPYDAAAVAYARTLKTQNINDILWRNPTSQQHSLSVSGGSDKVLYFFSGSYNKNLGSYSNTSFDKYTLRAKVDANISSNLKIGTNISYNRNYTSRFYWPYDNDNGQGFTVADFYRATFNLSRLYPFYSKADGTPTTAEDPAGYPSIQPGGGFNPAVTVRSGNYRHISFNTFNAILTAELKIPQVKGLSLRVLGDYRQDSYFQKIFIGQFNNSYRVQTASATGIGSLQYLPLKFDAGNTVVNNYGLAYTGIYETVNLSERYQLNGFIDYTRSFGNHHLTSFLGVEQSQYALKALNGNALNLLSSSNDQILNANTASQYRGFGGSELNQARLSYFGRAKYDFANKYIAEVSFRDDGSYIFPEGKQFGFFPSVSGAWIISKESFFNVKPISTLKARASYGTTGYDGLDGTTTNIAPYQFQNNYGITGSYVFANSTVLGLAPQAAVPNPDITWAINKTFNAGIDMGFLNDALAVSFDYFTTQRSHILVSSAAVVPGTFGAGLPSTNIGEQKAHGLEFAINYANKTGAFSYSIGVNFGYAIDAYVKWPQASTIAAFQNVIGLPTTGVARGYISQGIVRDPKTISALPAGFNQFGDPVILGTVLIKDINGASYAPGADGKVDVNDQAVISKNAVPRTNFGIPINVGWKSFSLGLLFQGVGPYDKFLTTNNTPYTSGGGVFQVGSRPYFSLWTDAYSDTNPNGKYPLATSSFSGPDLTGSSTTFWKRNGAYMRLKNINLAYSVPARWLGRSGITNLSVNLNATNLFTITSFKEYDPEQAQLDSYPEFKTYSFGLNLSF